MCRDSPDAQKDLVDPAVMGTTTVLRSVSKSKDTVKRVVLTSSVAGGFCVHNFSLLLLFLLLAYPQQQLLDKLLQTCVM